MKAEENKPFMPDVTAAGERKTALPAAASPQTQKRYNWKRILLGLVLVFFLFSIIFIIPVGRIPVLRNLTWLMGFSTQDTQSMSFGRALLTWAGDSERRARPGSWSGNDEISLFDRNQMPGFNEGGPQSGLFDLDQVNAARWAQGLPPEGLMSAWVGNENDPNRAAVNKPINDWSEDAKRNEANKNAQEVYFGTDAELASRAAAQKTVGFADFADRLSNNNVVGAASVDWLGLAVDKASALVSVPVAEGVKEISKTSVPLSNLGGNLKAGQKPQRDLAMIWLMSLAANKAPQLMLKKNLAIAGHMAMDMPKKVYDSAGQTTGVYISGDEVMANFETANQMLLAEEKCRDISSTANEVVKARFEQATVLVSSLRNVPKHCGDDMQSWSANLRSVKTNCKEVQDVFSGMKTFCGAKFKEGRCETARLDSYESSYNEICEGYENLSDEEKALRDQQLAQAASDIDYEVRDSFNLSVDGEKAGGNDFFPESTFE